MKDEEILRKAFVKAKNNGWNSEGYEYIVLSYDPTALPPAIIYTHDFAKAFWGSKKILPRYLPKLPPINGAWTAYRWHLTQMVLEENPIKYLEKFL